MFQRSHITFGVFVSVATFPGTLWVTTKNSEWLMWDSNTSRNDTPTYLYIVYMGNFQDQKKQMVLVGKLRI